MLIFQKKRQNEFCKHLAGTQKNEKPFGHATRSKRCIIVMRRNAVRRRIKTQIRDVFVPVVEIKQIPFRRFHKQRTRRGLLNVPNIARKYFYFFKAAFRNCSLEDACFIHRANKHNVILH